MDWLAEIGAHGVLAGRDLMLQQQPGECGRSVVRSRGITPTLLDLVKSTRHSPPSASRRPEHWGWNTLGSRRSPSQAPGVPAPASCRATRA
jgi:hypothetical protein